VSGIRGGQLRLAHPATTGKNLGKDYPCPRLGTGGVDPFPKTRTGLKR